jgi:hypothetical protein
MASALRGRRRSCPAVISAMTLIPSYFGSYTSFGSVSGAAASDASIGLQKGMRVRDEGRYSVA